MKKKIFAALLAVAVSFACTSAAFAQAEAPDTENEAASEEEYKAIGQAAEDALQVKLVNASGKGIKAVAVRKTEEEEPGENLLAEEDVFAADETRILYFTPQAAEIVEGREEAAADAQSPQTFVISLTFEDDTAAELHDFDFEAVEEASVRLEETVAYLVYQNPEDGTEVRTLEAEQALADGAAEPAAEEMPAEIIYYDDVYYDDAASGGSGGAAAPAPAGGQAPAGDVCLEGGLLN